MGGWKRSYHFHSNKTANVSLPGSSFKNSWSIILGYIQYSQEFIKEKKRDMEIIIVFKKIVANFVLNLAEKKNFALPHLCWTECQWSTWTIRDLVSPVRCVTSWSFHQTTGGRNEQSVRWIWTGGFHEKKIQWFLLSQNPRIFGSYIYIHIFVYVLLHQKNILLIHYQSYHNESLLRVFPQTRWREVLYPLSRLSQCEAALPGWLETQKLIYLINPLWKHCSCPHSLLSRLLFLRIIPTTSNNRWKHMKKHRTLIFPYDSLWFATVTLDPLPVLFCNQL